MAKKNDISIEDTLRQLEVLVNRLENDEVHLEAALAAFEEGIKLTRNAQNQLRRAEQCIQLLLEKDGEPQVEPFADEPTE
ncbi:MAG TPA: exodeoxyribonuclease VII small subunit [Halioglobus sp.]